MMFKLLVLITVATVLLASTSAGANKLDELRAKFLARRRSHHSHHRVHGGHSSGASASATSVTGSGGASAGASAMGSGGASAASAAASRGGTVNYLGGHRFAVPNPSIPRPPRVGAPGSMGLHGGMATGMGVGMGGAASAAAAASAVGSGSMHGHGGLVGSASAAAGAYSNHGGDSERSHFNSHTDHFQNVANGHADDNHHYQAQSFGKASDENLHEAYNKNHEDVEQTPFVFRRKTHGENYLRDYNKAKTETGSGVLAKDRHSSGFSTNTNRFNQNVAQGHQRHGPGFVSNYNNVVNNGFHDADDHFYNSDGLNRGSYLSGGAAAAAAAASAF